MPTCRHAGCEKETRARRLCASHYSLYKNTDLFKSGSKCTVEGCDRNLAARGYCGPHYKRFKRGVSLTQPPLRQRAAGLKCSIEGCEQHVRARGLCATHWSRQDRGADMAAEVQHKSVSTAPGHRRVSPQGYILVYSPEHPKAYANNYQLEHRLVMEHALERVLFDNENVHHKNGNRADNRLENLELWSKAQPAGQRVEDKVQWAVDILKTYAPEKLAIEGVAQCR